MATILITAVFAALLASVLGIALGFFREFFAVEQDPLAGLIREALPGANCGACGFPGCDGYALAAASRQADTGACSVGGQAVAEKIAALLGTNAEAVEPAIMVLACQGSKEHAPLKGEYTGIPTCRGAKLSAGGTRLCAWGCLGFGDCGGLQIRRPFHGGRRPAPYRQGKMHRLQGLCRRVSPAVTAGNTPRPGRGHGALFQP